MSIAPYLSDPPELHERASFDLVRHGHQDLVQAVAFNGHGDRCATGSVDGKIRVFNRHKDGSWRLCDTWGAHASEILEVLFLFYCPVSRCPSSTLTLPLSLLAAMAPDNHLPQPP